MFRNTFKTTVLAGLGGLMVAIGSLFGRGGAIIGLALGLVIVGFSYWKSDKLAIRAARAVPADEALHPQYFAVMRELSAKASVCPCPACTYRLNRNRMPSRPAATPNTPR